jgi:hypothetical protein
VRGMIPDKVFSQKTPFKVFKLKFSWKKTKNSMYYVLLKCHMKGVILVSF